MISEFVYKLKYARYNQEAQRRETWPESVERYMSMHKRRFPNEADLMPEVEQALLNKRILPSMRGLQFGGEGIERKNMRLYNCTSSYCDRPRFFAEALWLLLCGSGVGFSVQRHHVAQLPSLTDPLNLGEAEWVIEDSIEGWADAVNMLIAAYTGRAPRPLFNYEEIRPEGAPLSVGGKAPGHLPLKQALENIEPILKGAIGRQLKPIEAFDIVMHLANCTVTAGTRRSATIALFSIDDDEMMNAKVGEWYLTAPQRARANISAVVTPDTEESAFRRLFSSTKQFGEPAFLFLNSTEHAVNPCVEIVMCPTLITKNGEVIEEYTLELLDPNKRQIHESNGYSFESGWQACNLTSVNVSACRSDEDLIEAAALAAQLGTYQASYTETDYLGEVSRQIIEREALLGVSLCGIMERPEIALNEKTLTEAALWARQRNKSTALRIGINPASRVTCVKPEGTASLVLNTSSGIHPSHAKRYLRRVQVKEHEAVFQMFQEANPQAVEKSAWGSDYCVVFPMTSQGLTKGDFSAIKLLEAAKHVKRYWIDPTTDTARLEGASHNVSLTVTVNEDEWQGVEDFLWNHTSAYTGVSLLPSSGDYDYEQAPLQRVSEDMTGEKEQAAWSLYQKLSSTMQTVDYNQVEETDETAPMATIACAGGACELI